MARSAWRRVLVCAALAVVAVVPQACLDTPAPGSWGKFRYAGNVKGAVPLNLLPPISDRNGGIYEMAGALTVPDVDGFIGPFGSSWAHCGNRTRGDRFGLHGWVGFSQDKSYIWSGDGIYLLAAGLPNSFCGEVLGGDPTSGSQLIYRAVIPYVREAPSSTTLVALVQSPSDPTPFWAKINLNVTKVTDFIPFMPGSAREVVVIGTGADGESGNGFVLVQYKVANEVHVEARFLDANANQYASTPLNAGALEEYGVVGYLQSNGNGLVAGLLKSGKLLVFDTSGGALVNLPGMKPAGLHRWNGNLWAVGTWAGRPVISSLDDRGNPSPPVVWAASEAAAARLTSTITVIDDRSLPSRAVGWNATNAAGPFPFVTAFSPHPYGTDTALGTVAGPSYDVGGAKFTAFAIAPVGITYP
ncbi:MAG: hypothetical protein NVSMB1_02720 [Polyangiales bacterium]